ncbi:unnamed protein product [Diatraea saccharalis]|uniref:Uncharacterized protein n=1 Tax=Diatraea saccharalis TaxID=40085 RepID=A0A9N9RG03_9NEOP|nr:unnamed protein product [Diatraea saccharalis]
MCVKSQCSSQERLLAVQAPCEPPPRAPCPHCHQHQNSLNSSQGSGMNNWASLSDSGGSGHTAARAPSPQSPARRVRSRSLSGKPADRLLYETSVLTLYFYTNVSMF